MRKTIVIVAFAISLMSTKCAEEPVNIVFDNKSERNIVFSSIKNADTLKNVILEESYHDSRFKYLKNNQNKISNQVNRQYSINNEIMEKFNSTIKIIERNELLLLNKILPLKSVIKMAKTGLGKSNSQCIRNNFRYLTRY